MMQTSSFANQVVDVCGSTNDLAKQLAEQDYPPGTWVSARVQKAGRGRLAREWKSENGNLFLSTLIQVEDTRLWTWVPLTTAIAVILSLRQKYSSLDLKIKWPNDIYFKDKKLGGILCESFKAKTHAYIVVGIGLNCSHSPNELSADVTDLTSIRGIPTAADEIRSSLHLSLLQEIHHLTQNGPTKMLEIYYQYAYFTQGTEVTWGVSSDLKKGRVGELGPSGELKVEVNGKWVSLFAEDLQTSRIRRKL